MSDRGKIIDFIGWKNNNPLETHETLIRALMRDINISIDPTLTATKESITLHWQTEKGEMDVTLIPKSGRVVVDAQTTNGYVSIDEAVSTIANNNRWVGYLFDDNFYE